VRVNATTSLSRMEVVADTDGLTLRAGTALLTGLAAAIGLIDGLVEGLRIHSRGVLHEPGRIVRDLSVMLADGGDCLADLGALRDQGAFFGELAPDAKAYPAWSVSTRGCSHKSGPPAPPPASAPGALWEHPPASSSTSKPPW